MDENPPDHFLKRPIYAQPRVVQERLGHANINTTLTVYSHVLDHMQDEAAEKAGGVVAIPSFHPIQ